MKYSVVIATYNRANDLRETLDSLSGLRPDGDWEVIVVDNNSTDDTRQVVQVTRDIFPAPLRYLVEPEQGRSPALNAGIRLAHGDIIVTTDDDVRVDADWLDRAGAGLESHGCDYIGGRVLPIWGGPRPAWLANHGGQQWAVIALLDYGPEPMVDCAAAGVAPRASAQAVNEAAVSRTTVWSFIDAPYRLIRGSSGTRRVARAHVQIAGRAPGLPSAKLHKQGSGSKLDGTANPPSFECPTQGKNPTTFGKQLNCEALHSFPQSWRDLKLIR